MCDASEFRTKNDIACDMIENMSKQKKIFCFVFDTWYSNRQIIDWIKENNRYFVTQIKSNRNVTISYRSTAIRQHAKHIKDDQFREVIVNGKRFRIFSTSAFISNIGSICLVFSKMWLGKKKNKWSDIYYLMTDLVSFSDEDILRLYLVRGGIEGFHREAKQHLGLESYQIRKNLGIERYLFWVMLVYALLIMLIMLPLGK